MDVIVQDRSEFPIDLHFEFLESSSTDFRKVFRDPAIVAIANRFADWTQPGSKALKKREPRSLFARIFTLWRDLSPRKFVAIAQTCGAKDELAATLVLTRK